MHQLLAAPLLAAALLTAGGVPAAAAPPAQPLTEPFAAELPEPLQGTRIEPATGRLDGHTSRGCSFLFLRWC